VKHLVIIDCETGGLDPKADPLIEVAAVIWNVEHRAIVESRSWLVESTTNEAEAINRIPVGLLSFKRPRPRDKVVEMVLGWAQYGEAIAGHNVGFDLGFLPELRVLPAIDTKDDLEWPGVKLGASLNETSLGVLGYAVYGHRALADCLTLAHCLERVARTMDAADMNGTDEGRFDLWLAEGLNRAMSPRATYVVADTGYDPKRNELAKAAGFRWVPETKQWRRTMRTNEVAALPFRVQEVSP
jgi:DNA polymerase-3 subunit epsilon